MSNTKTSILRFNIDQQCPIQYVTVYNDRAEVKRLLQHRFDTEGTYDLVYEGFSPFVDLTSLHVGGGTGRACTILEVSYQTCYENLVSQTDVTSLDQLQNELDKIDVDIGAHERELARLDKQRAWIDGRASKIMNQDGQLNTVDLDAMNEFMGFYHKILLKLDDTKINAENEINKLTQRRNALQIKISEYGVEDQSSHRNERREMTITVHIASRFIDVDLELSYLISNCSWSASYDVRVTSTDAFRPKTQLTYYGVIVNKSQENWSDVRLSLSTATPSLGGVPPKLPTLKINYYQPCYNYYQLNELEKKIEDGTIQFAQFSSSDESSRQSRKSGGFVTLKERSTLNSDEILVEDEQEILKTIHVLSTTTEESMLNANFTILRRSTIDADGKPHKVTIGLVDLTSTFIYTVIPKLSLHAYLKASTINTSDKQLLAGPVSVFMDNNFITHSSIANVCLGEKFDLSLGTDSSIKVEYKPMKKITDTQGLISKTYHESIRHETHVINTKSTEVIVYVYEQVPLSLDEKIKVKLVVPDLRIKELNSNCVVTLNDGNNLEWKCTLQPRCECRLPLEYTLEWPTGKRIECKEE